MSDEARQRYRQACISGARPLNHIAWREVLAKATTIAECEHQSLSASFEAADLSERWRNRPRHNMVAYDQVPVSYQMLLSVEAKMAEVQMMLDEYERLAKDLANEAIGQRLLRTLDEAKATITARIEKERRNHLKVIP